MVRRYPPSNTGKSEKSSFTNVGINGTLNDNSINTVLIAPELSLGETNFLADVLFDFYICTHGTSSFWGEGNCTVLSFKKKAALKWITQYQHQIDLLKWCHFLTSRLYYRFLGTRSCHAARGLYRSEFHLAPKMLL